MHTLSHKPRIVVGINSLTNTNYESYTNHIQLFYRFGKQYPDCDFILSNPARMSIDRMRNLSAQAALECDAEYLLFIDDDVLVPMDGLEKLIKTKADIASGKVVIRGYPFDWMVFKFEKRDGKKGLYSQPVLPETGIVDVAAVGFSFTLIKTEVLKLACFGNNFPWFCTGLNNTEDIYFCTRAREANPKLKIVVDCSVDCGHILWPEVMNGQNREAYRRYWLEMNPSVNPAKDSIKQTDDRGEEYMNLVKGTVGNE